MPRTNMRLIVIAAISYWSQCIITLLMSIIVRSVMVVCFVLLLHYKLGFPLSFASFIAGIKMFSFLVRASPFIYFCVLRKHWSQDAEIGATKERSRARTPTIAWLHHPNDNPSMRLPIYHRHHYSIGFDFDLSIVDLNLKFYDLLADLLRWAVDGLSLCLPSKLHFLLYYPGNGKFTAYR